MASIISLGVSFLLFFIVLGFMWIFGANIIANIILSLPAIPEGEGKKEWDALQETNKNNIKLAFTVVPGILVLFASIKMLVNASSRGAD